jgi:hypothetical protein
MVVPAVKLLSALPSLYALALMFPPKLSSHGFGTGRQRMLLEWSHTFACVYTRATSGSRVEGEPAGGAKTAA